MFDPTTNALYCSIGNLLSSLIVSMGGSGPWRYAECYPYYNAVSQPIVC